MAVVAYADEHYPEADVVYYYRSSSPAFALHFGDMWAGERHTFLIAKLHPRARFFSVWSGVIEGPDLDPAVPAIMQGTPHPDGRPGFGRYAARVFGNESEAIFELR